MGMQLLKCSLALALTMPLFAADAIRAAQPFVTHEWGTFTSVAGEDGRAVDWAPLSGPADLPCFVARLDLDKSPKWFPGLVRMETPVLYFYPPQNMTLSVHVDFPQ